MARWKLMASHYLNVEDETWEYTEQNRRTGRTMRTQYPVPRHLDPRDPTCWTNKWGSNDDQEGEIVVCHKGKGDQHDIVFFGDPTPDMLPVDDEAKAISAGFADRWKYKPDASNADFSQSLIDKFQSEMEVVRGQTAAAPAADFSELTTAILALAKSNADVVEIAKTRRV